MGLPSSSSSSSSSSSPAPSSASSSSASSILLNDRSGSSPSSLPSLIPTRLPPFDLFRPGSASSVTKTSEASATLEPGTLSEDSLLECYCRWLCQICNTTEGCFAFETDNVQEVIAFELESVESDTSTRSFSLQLTRQSCSDESATDFALVLNASQSKAAKCCLSLNEGTARLQCEMTAPIATQSLLSAFLCRLDAETTSSRSSFNFPLVEEAPCALLHNQFEQRALEMPDQPALDFLEAWTNDGRADTRIVLSYAELDKRANILAHRLLEKTRALSPSTAWPGSVPLLLGPSPALYIAILASLKAGLAFSPLPVDAPTERLSAIIHDQQAPLALYSSRNRQATSAALPASESMDWLDIADLEQQHLVGESDNDRRPTADIATSDLAYILYTSGSTGLPKGVQITHSSVSASISAHLQRADMPSSKNRWFQFASPTFDPSVMEIFCTLSSGATLCSAERSLTLSDLNRVVAASQADIMMATPSLARLLQRQRVPHLRSLWTMGEALSTEVMEEFADQEGTSLLNAYGPTEASINCTLLPMQRTFRGSILGPALDTASLFIVDPETLQVLPQGLAGELIIGGPQVSQRGYLNRPTESGKSFIDVDHLGGRVYRSGDSARVVWTPAGEPWIEVLGRISGSRQIKINGQRLELAEVENCHGKEPRITFVKALQTKDGSLALFVQTTESLEQEDAANLEQSLRDNAAEGLPLYARPRHYAFTNRSFISQNGKLDFRAVDSFVNDAASAATDSAAPTPSDTTITDPSLAILVDALRKITGLMSIAPSTTLASISLDSLAAMKLLDNLRSSGDDKLATMTLRDLVGQTEPKLDLQGLVAGLDGATSSRDAQQQSVASRLAAFDKAHRLQCSEKPAQVLPVTATQAGILASFMRSHSYIHHFCYEVKQDVDIERFCSAAQTVFSSAEAMRSTYIPVDDEKSPFAQCILEQYEHPVQQVSLDEAPKDGLQIQKALEAAAKDMRLDAPSFKHQLFKGPRRLVYAVSLLHANFDGGSLALLMQDVATLYRTGEVPSRPGPSFAVQVDIRSALDSEGQRTIEYWKQELREYEPEAFPCVNGLKTGISQSIGTGLCEYRSSSLSLQDLEEAARRLLGRSSSPSPLALVQLVWALLLNTYSETSKSDVVFGSVVSNRLDSLTRACAAPTFTTIPVRLDTTTNQTIQSALDALVTKSSRALPHSQPPLGSIVTENGSLPYDTLLALQLFEEQAEELLWTSESSPAMVNDFAIMTEIWPGATDKTEALRFRMTYKQSVLDESSSTMLLKQFAAFLDALCKLTPEETASRSLTTLFQDLYQSHNRLCSRDGSTEVTGEVYNDLLLHRQFEEHARQRPNADALLFSPSLDGQASELPVRISYGQLDLLASRLASRLRRASKQLGLPLLDQPIPLYLGKSIEMFIAVLGILKAGGAWCPIEPTMPLERKAALINRTKSKVVVFASRACEHEPDVGQEAGMQEFSQCLSDAGLALEQGLDVSLGWTVDGQSIVIDDQSATEEAQDPADIRPNNLAYLIWTSGTTGLPKGVMVEHRAASRAMRALQQAIALPVPCPRTINFSAFTFDVFVEDLFYGWGLGGCLVSAPQRTLVDPSQFIKLAEVTQATNVNLTPAFSAVLGPRSQCPSLRVVTEIGEKLGEDVAEAWEGSTSDASHCPVKDGFYAYNTSGPAENAVVSSLRSFQAGRIHNAANVGRPLPGVQHIVMRDSIPLPRGATGELVYAGGQIARGYLGDAERTAKSFPTMQPYGSLYFTGDFVRMTADGSLDFIGRRDDLVKIAGQRIELSEITHALLRSHELLRHVETMYLPATKEGSSASKIIVAFLVTSASEEESKRAIIASVETRAKKTLSKHMRPGRFVVVDAIPRNNSGKRDRRGLADFFYRSEQQTSSQKTNDVRHHRQYAPIDPSTPEAELAHQVMAIIEGPDNVKEDSWGRLVEDGSISVRTLGLDSIKTIRLSTKLRQLSTFKSDVAAFDLMRCDTFEDLCQVVIPNRAQGVDATMVSPESQDDSASRQALERYSREWQQSNKDSQYQSVYPCSLLQTSLLVETAKDSRAYWSTRLFQVQSGMTQNTLRSAWLTLAKSVEMLRTRFLSTQYGFAQGVLAADALDEFADIKAVLEGSDRQGAINTRIEEVTSNADGLPWALTILTSSSSGPLHLVLHMHHALYDGTAFEKLLDSYEAILANSHSSIASQKLLTVLAALDETAIAYSPAYKLSQSRDNYWKSLLSRHAPRCTPWSLPDLTGQRQSKSASNKMHSSERQLQMDPTSLRSVVQRLALPSAAVLVQAAFGCLIADYLDQGTVLIGSTLSDRGLSAALEDAIFPLVSTVPFLVDAGRVTKEEREEGEAPAATLTVAELLRGLGDQYQASSVPSHRYITAREVRQKLNWTQDQPLYAALFVVHDETVEEDGAAAGSRALESIGNFDLSVEHPFVLNVYVDQSGSPAKIVVSALDTVLSASHTNLLAEQVANQIHSLISAALEQPDQLVSGLAPSMQASSLLSIQPPKYTDELTATSADRHPCHWVRHYAREHPDRIAAAELVDELPDATTEHAKTRSWTFSQLDAASDHYSRLLLDRIGSSSSESPARVVALCMGRTLEAFACVLAIMKAGCVYLPIAEDLPDQRKKELVTDAAAAAIFVSHGLGAAYLQDASGDFAAKIIDVDGAKHEVDLDSKAPLPLGPSQSTGYLLFTSGSTGKPKGVSVSGANLSSFVDGYAAILAAHSPRSLQLTQEGGGRYLNSSSRAFDPHISQMFTAWRMGYATVTGERTVLLEDLIRTVNCLGITHMGALPSLVEQSGLTPANAPSLALLGVGGEKITQFVLDEWTLNHGSPNSPVVVNLIGPTEATIGISAAIVEPTSTPGSIGFPIGNTTALLLLPETDTLAWRGQIGEYCVAGDLVAHGRYIGEAARKPNGFVEINAAILGGSASDTTTIYRTGDRASMLADGSLLFLGRADEQIKIRGQRLELGEVNAVLRELAAKAREVAVSTQEAVTVYLKHPGLPSPRLFTILSLGAQSQGVKLDFATDQQALVETINAECREKLPNFMIPTVVIVQALPRLPSGKMDGKKVKLALQEADLNVLLGGSSQPGEGGAEARSQLTSLESEIVKILLSITGRDASADWIRPATSVWEFGIDSLSAVGLSVRLREEPIAMNVTVAEIFVHDTIAALAALKDVQLEAAEEVRAAYDPVVFDAAAREVAGQTVDNIEFIRPSMPLQESLIALSRMAREKADQSDTALPYIQHLCLAPGSGNQSNSEEVAAKWQSAIEREPMLRTCFQEDSDGQLLQVILQTSNLALSSLVTQQQGAVDSAKPQASIIGQVDRVPPFRVVIDEDSAIANLWIHHCLYDGSTLPRLLRDVYEPTHEDSRRSAASPYDAGLISSAMRAQGIKARRFWTEYFADHNPSTLSFSRGGRAGSGQADRLERIKLSWDSDTTDRLRRAAQSSRLSMTLSNLMQACLAVVLARQTSSCDVVIGNVFSGRLDGQAEGAELSRLPTVSTVPVRHRLRGGDADNGLHEALKGSKKSTAAAQAWVHSSLRVIQKAVGRGGLFEVLFSYDAAPTKGSDSAYRIVSTQDDSEQKGASVDYPLVLNVVEPSDAKSGLTAILAFSQRAVGNDVAQSLASHFCTLLDLVIQGREIPLDDLGITRTNDQSDTQAEVEDRPLTEKEQRARDILAPLVQCKPEEVGPHTSFYRVGLDSILAIRLARQLRGIGLQGVDAVKIMESGCLSKLFEDKPVEASRIEEPKVNGDRHHSSEPSESESNGDSAFSDLGQRLFEPLNKDDELEAVYECTPLQAGMLTVSAGSSQSAYHQVHKLRLEANVDLDRLRKAWEATIQSNDILRTTFHLDVDGSRWIGLAHSRAPSIWAQRELKSGQLSDPSIAAEGTTTPLVRVEILLDQTKRPLAFFHIHHACYDGASLPVIFAQLRAEYHLLAESSEGRAQQRPTPFWSAAQEISAHRGQYEEEWSQSLQDYDYAPLPGREQDDVETKRWRASSQVTLKGDGSSLTTAARAVGVTLHSVCALAYAKALSSMVLRRRDVVFGHVLDGRSQQSAESENELPIVGPMFNTVARRVKFGDLLETNGEAALRVQASLNATMSKQSASLREVIRHWRSSSSSNRSATRLFDCLFVYHKGGRPKTDKDSLWTAWQEEDSPAATEGAAQPDDEYEINVSFVERPDGALDVFANASNMAVNGEGEVQSLVDRLAAIVSDILVHPSASVLKGDPSLFDLPLASQRQETRSINGPDEDDTELTGDEEELCAVLATTLPRMSSNDWQKASTNVADLGIDSITAIRLASECRKKGGVLASVTVLVILRGQTIRGIIQEASKTRSRGKTEGLTPSAGGEQDRVTPQQKSKVSAVLQSGGISAEAEEIEDIFDILAGQAHHLDLWYASGRRFYEAPWVFRAENTRIDSNKFEAAWRYLVNRHSILRTTFVVLDDKAPLVRQVVFKADASVLPQLVVVPVDSNEAVEQSTKQIVSASNTSPSTLFVPPVRINLVVGPTSSAFVLRCHHGLYDAWSMPMMTAELMRLYDGTAKDQAVPLSFGDIARRVLTTHSKQDQRAWWQQHLAGADQTWLQAPEVEPSALGPQAFVRFPKAVSNVSRIEDSIKAQVGQGVNLSHVVILALARLLKQATQAKASPTFGFYNSSRAAVADLGENIENAAVPLLNVLPMTVKLQGSGKESLVRELVQIKESLSERVEWEQSFLQDVTRITHGDEPLFDCFLNLLWHNKASQEADEAARSAEEASDAEQKKPTWQHWKMEESAAYFSSAVTAPVREQADGGTRPTTALGVSMDTSYLPQSKCFFDVRRDAEGDVLSFGVKADVALFTGPRGEGSVKVAEERLQGMCGQLAELIKAVVTELE